MKKWLEKLKKQAEQAKAAEFVDVDHSRFSDPFSKQVGWTPVKPGGTNFGTHYLTEPESGGRLLVFKATKGGMAFGLLFLLVGLAIVVFVLSQIITGQGFQLLLVALLVGLPFLLVGLFLVRWLTRPRVFDLVSQEYYCGFNKSDSGQQTDLSRVKALQLITEEIKSSKSRYNSYELNLVLNDTIRVNVIDHGNYERILIDAEKLAKALHVPLWDNT